MAEVCGWHRVAATNTLAAALTRGLMLAPGISTDPTPDFISRAQHRPNRYIAKLAKNRTEFLPTEDKLREVAARVWQGPKEPICAPRFRPGTCRRA
jgi:hypothetical protein